MVFEHEFGKLVDNKDGHHGVVAICLLYFAALVFMEYYRGGEEDDEEEEEYPRPPIGCIKQESTDEEKGHEEGEKNEFDGSNDENVLLLFDSVSNCSEDESNMLRAGSVSPPIEDVESISIQIDEEEGDDEEGDELFDDENEWLLG